MLCTGCDSLVEEINSYQLHPEKRTTIHTQQTQSRNKTPKKLCVVGGLSGFDSPDSYLNSVDCFHLKDENKWQEMAPMCVARESAGNSLDLNISFSSLENKILLTYIHTLGTVVLYEIFVSPLPPVSLRQWGFSTKVILRLMILCCTDTMLVSILSKIIQILQFKIWAKGIQYWRRIPAGNGIHVFHSG